ncbi:MAG: LuxR family transcriptional regulator, partial [Streptosporangiaceae bacterium]|nr:LuxR family transcriptional regulator [Streptosporangiaceae bacterium]
MFDQLMRQSYGDMAMTVMAAGRRAGNLPAELTSFVGRRREVAEVRRLLSVSRLVTLTGVGGVGKTRLALRAAVEFRRAFDETWLVDLAGLIDPSLVVPTVAATVGLCDQSERPPLPVLSDFLAPKRMLLVLDNCEHLLDACAELADALLRAAPELRILATSRQSLRIEGEFTMAIAPLPVPAGDQPPLSPEALGQYEAVSLFADRAAAVLPGFILDGSNAMAVARLCRQLDGIPLAIELAAVRLRALSVGEIEERLGDRYGLLTGGSRAALPRQRTLRALVDWSFSLLSTAERHLWARLSVFAGDFGLDAVEGTCAGEGISADELPDLLADLVDKSLLLRHEHLGEGRYRLLETLRQFGQEKLSEYGQRELMLSRHRDWYQRLAEQALAEWFGPRQVSWFNRLRLERANLRAALEYCLSEPGEAETGLRMASVLLRPFWLPNAFFSEGRMWLARLLEKVTAGTARAKGLCANAWLALMQGDAATALSMLEEGGRLADQLDDPASSACVLRSEERR